jgi:glycosyltransferase involved in cell wall biosynthesis
MTRILLYSPANLNNVDGSAVWVQSVAETLHLGPTSEIVLPLRAVERRDVITGLLRRLPRVELIPAEQAVRKVGPNGLTTAEVIDLIERLDRHKPFDVILIRSFEVAQAAVRSRRLSDRLWSTYILEPERDTGSADYLRDLTELATGSRYLVAQSEEMRALTEALVPAARGKTILLPPAIPARPAQRADPDRIVPRLIYTGKFHPFYPVNRMIEFYQELRAEIPGLEFHVVGDKIHRPREDPLYAPTLERALTHTPGVIWHGAVPRDQVETLVAEGGVALSLWDYRHGSRMNDLVISTKLLDYASVGVPVILNRTAAQETVLGPDYPLFVRRTDEALPLLRRTLSDPGLYREAAERTFAGSRAFTYPNVFAHLEPFLREGNASAAELLARAKLPGAERNIGVLGLAVGPDRLEATLDLALAVATGLGTRDERFRLIVAAPAPIDRPAERLALTFEPAVDLPNWLRMVGPVIVDPDDSASIGRVRAAGSTPISLGPPEAILASVLAPAGAGGAA